MEMRSNQTGNSPFFEIGKPRIAFAATLSVLPGFFLQSPDWRGGSIFALASLLSGTFLLSFGAGSLNNLQDASIDKRSARTNRRALPSGRMKSLHAILIVIAALVSGELLLFSGAGFAAGILGFGAVLLYNGIYTPLKKKTPFALWPGTLTGAIPPLMGNAAASGPWDNPALYWISGFYIIWQVPHFLLILLRYGSAYSDAGIPTLLNRFSETAISRITFQWIVGVGVFVQLLVLYIPHPAPLLSILLGVATLWVFQASLGLIGFQNFAMGTTRKTLLLRMHAYSLIFGITISARGIL